MGLGLAVMSGCSAGSVSDTEPTTGGSTPGTTATTTPPSRGPFAFTHLRPDGNRFLDGTGSLPAQPMTFELEFTPAWLLGLPAATASDWIAVSSDGRTAGIHVEDSAIEAFEPPIAPLPAGLPPILAPGDSGPRLLRPPTEQASTLTHPFPLGNGRSLLVGRSGDVLLWDGAVIDRLSASVLPDARLTKVAESTYAVLDGATDRYGHGALGDDVEAGAILLMQVNDGLAREGRIRFEESVAEGLKPIAATLAGDSTSQLLVTLTDRSAGARLAAYGLDGARLATGPSVGTGFRWRHQLCVAPFGPDGETEIAAVKTPHIGGIVEFYQRRGDRLDIVAEAGHFSSHTFGSRNLDGGLAADLDGDGSVELLVPTQSRDELVALRRTAGGIETAWELAVPPRLSTNVAGLQTADGQLVIAAGSGDGTLRFWQ